MSLERVFRSIGRALNELGADWALIGGLAVGARTEPRFTRDVDLAVAVTDDRAAETLLRGLMKIGYVPVAMLEQTAVGRLATVRLELPGPDAHLVDLLFASSGIEGETVSEAELVEVFPGLSAPVARVAHLIALKLLARNDEAREQDRGDLRRLLQIATHEDLRQVRVLLTRIQERGYHRGNDLDGLLTLALREFRQDPGGES